ncbi:MAG TPA: AAA family ATPase [Chloroflexia bacterium]|nr:AAA family ATPase [Chloroflexia bacterium]
MGDRGEREITLPHVALVVLAGPSGAGKSTFAARHFTPTQVVSSDQMRAMISDDEADQSVSAAAFQLVHEIVCRRLAAGRLTVVDSTALRAQRRRDFLRDGQRFHVPVILIVFRGTREVCLARDAQRTRQVGAAVIDQQLALQDETIRRAAGEGFDRVYVLDPTQAEQVRFNYAPLPGERGGLGGPFDVIGDIHGCADELRALLTRLDYAPDAHGAWRHPAGRTFVLLGDLTDRGPDSAGVLRIAVAAVAAGAALYTPGNHCNKLLRHLLGHRVKVGHGLAETIAQLDALPASERQPLVRAVTRMIADAPPYLVLDGGRLVVAHAGIKEWMVGQMSRRIQTFTLYGDVSGDVDADGFPLRHDWAADYRGSHAIVYGHTVVPEPVWRNNTINIDQGCVFGGRLTCLRWPERTIVQVPAARAYSAQDRVDLDGISAA